MANVNSPMIKGSSSSRTCLGHTSIYKKQAKLLQQPQEEDTNQSRNSTFPESTTLGHGERRKDSATSCRLSFVRCSAEAFFCDLQPETRNP